MHLLGAGSEPFRNVVGLGGLRVVRPLPGYYKRLTAQQTFSEIRIKILNFTVLVPVLHKKAAKTHPTKDARTWHVMNTTHAHVLVSLELSVE